MRQRLNRFRHIAQLADHRARAVTTPNNDTFYSSAWLDLSRVPLLRTLPALLIPAGAGLAMWLVMRLRH